MRSYWPGWDSNLVFLTSVYHTLPGPVGQAMESRSKAGPLFLADFPLC